MGRPSGQVSLCEHGEVNSAHLSNPPSRQYLDERRKILSSKYFGSHFKATLLTRKNGGILLSTRAKL